MCRPQPPRRTKHPIDSNVFVQALYAVALKTDDKETADAFEKYYAMHPPPRVA